MNKTLHLGHFHLGGFEGAPYDLPDAFRAPVLLVLLVRITKAATPALNQGNTRGLGVGELFLTHHHRYDAIGIRHATRNEEYNKLTLLAGFDLLIDMNCGARAAHIVEATQRALRLAEAVLPRALHDCCGHCCWSMITQPTSSGKTCERFCSVPELRHAGFSAIDLSNAGCTPANLLHAGFSDVELHSVGIEFDKGGDLWEPALSRRKRKTSNRCMLLLRGAAACKQAGYSASELKAAGFGVLCLKQAGFQIDEIMDSGFRLWQLAQYYDVEDWEAIGVIASDFRLVGLSAVQLQRAGYTARFVAEAGYKGAELIAAGYSIESLDSAVLSVLPTWAKERDTDSRCDVPEYWQDFYDDGDCWYDFYLSCLDMWFAKESREASRSRTISKGLKMRNHTELLRLQQLKCAKERHRPRHFVSRKFSGAPAKTLKASLMILTS